MMFPFCRPDPRLSVRRCSCRFHSRRPCRRRDIIVVVVVVMVDIVVVVVGVGVVVVLVLSSMLSSS